MDMVTQYFRLPATRLALVFTFSCILGSTGCSLFTSQGGEILISRPEVFTRQRLVNRRLAEQQWLETQLAATPTTQTFQGLQDIRIFDGFYNKTGVTFDPLAGKTAVAQNNLNVQSLQNQTEKNSLQHQIEMAKLQQQLAAVKNSATDTSGAPSGSAGSGSPLKSGHIL
jgi:predicted metal-dependent hydrolase